ncbi:hypothetical protein HYI36_12835 [Bacillus sp. Gen3]|nr:hypothetical protein [Bacillus sp. Gen3]
MDNREIDKLVAEKVMGWKVIEGKGIMKPIGRSFWRQVDDFYPSINMESAWQVVEKLDFDVKVTKHKDSSYQCHVFIPDNIQMVFDKTAPLAICKAALHAVGIEVEKE